MEVVGVLMLVLGSRKRWMDRHLSYQHLLMILTSCGWVQRWLCQVSVAHRVGRRAVSIPQFLMMVVHRPQDLWLENLLRVLGCVKTVLFLSTRATIELLVSQLAVEVLGLLSVTLLEVVAGCLGRLVPAVSVRLLVAHPSTVWLSKVPPVHPPPCHFVPEAQRVRPALQAQVASMIVASSHVIEVCLAGSQAAPTLCLTTESWLSTASSTV